jgi:hypothetical protein
MTPIPPTVVDMGARILGDILVAALRRPDVVEAIRAVTEAPTSEAEPADRLRTKRELAMALGVSVSTIDRLTREGMPVAAHVGDARRYDVAACRAWLGARGKRPTTAPRSGREPDIDDVIEAAGLVRR